MERAAWTRIGRIQEKKKRIALGLMSGTSGDGVDLALVEISGRDLATKIKLLAFNSYPYPRQLRKRILELNAAKAEEICEMNFILGEFFASRVLKFLHQYGYQAKQIDFLGSHGHTVYHISQVRGKINSTLQIGEGAVMAARTGILTVCDFRPGDIAAGGLGAPLVPLADFVLFREKGRVRAFVNIGGIANVTVVPEKLEKVLAFDTGPGNMVIDALVSIYTRGKKKFDNQGRIAAQGKVQEELLNRMRQHPYFRLEPPKSTGRETFGKVFLKEFVRGARKAPLPDLIATATYLTAISIFDAFKNYIFPKFRIDEVFISGGGMHNKTLLSFMKELFPPIPIKTIDTLGIDGDAKEAVAFALLADATLQGISGNVPGATGAERSAILGKIVFP
ncbi:MAG: anhydro-N-acetylmuramic acid kinase [Thermodesulfobacteriota bacterium]